MCLIDADALQKFFCASRDGDVTRIMERENIPFFRGVGGRPCTTEKAINDALGLESVGQVKSKKEYTIDFQRKNA